MENHEIFRALDMISKVAEQAMAHNIISIRAQDAHDYAEKYLFGVWGKNVWHVILDDAIRMRKELENAKSTRLERA